MKRRLALCSISFAATAFLVACGGGSEDAVQAVPDINEIKTFPLADFSKRDVNFASYDTSVRTGIKTGKVTNSSFTNADTYEEVSEYRTRLPNSFFEGAAVIPFKNETFIKNRRVNGKSLVDVNRLSVSVYDSVSSNFAGSFSNSSYMVVSRVNSYPKVVNVGDGGSHYEAVVYADETKSTRLGSVSATWKVESIEPRLFDSLGVAVAVISQTQNNYDTNNRLVARITSRTKLTYNLDAFIFGELSRSSKTLTTVQENLSGAETGVFTTVWN